MVFYNHANTGIPSGFVLSIAIDGAGNKRIGTDGGGLAVYTGGVGIEERYNVELRMRNAEITKLDPNPFISSILIHYSVS